MRMAIYCIIMLFCIMGCNQKQPIVEEPRISAEERARLDSLAKVEAARADSIRQYEKAQAESLSIEREKKRIKDLKKTIQIINVYPSKPNSAGGVDAHTVWKNTSNKVVKYISFEWDPYNAVGDVVGCSIRGYRRTGGKVTGPINPGQTYGYGYYWDCMWYNNTIKKLKLTKIEIDYMDGTTKTIETSDIEHVYKKQ